MQKVTGTLSQGAHPGSYNGQDAYNDMLITERVNGLAHRKRANSSALPESEGGCVELYARSASSVNYRGG